LVYFKGKLVIPTNLCFRILTWYHENLLHPGTNQMFHTILQHFTWPSLHSHKLKTSWNIATLANITRHRE
jgi:hypothetical protein